VIAAARLRRGNVASATGARRLLAQAINTARAAGVTGQIMTRTDSAYCHPPQRASDTPRHRPNTRFRSQRPFSCPRPANSCGTQVSRCKRLSDSPCRASPSRACCAPQGTRLGLRPTSSLTGRLLPQVMVEQPSTTSRDLFMTTSDRLLGRLIAAVAVGVMTAASATTGASATLTTAGVSITTAQVSSSPTLIGAWSRDWPWFDAAVGPVQVYRGYDGGFHYATWQQVPVKHAHPGGVNDYSFQLPPGEVAAGLHDAKLKTFIASTPENIVLTNHHEPEQEIDAGEFTASAFRKAQARLNMLVDAQNAIDGGTRKVSVILMTSTFTGFKGRNAENYWPTLAKGDGGTVDLISVDVYAAPHATNTSGVPAGYTSGLNWKHPSVIMKPALVFAETHATDWAVSELGYLEDVNNPTRKADALRAAVTYAMEGKPTATSAPYRPALWISYWDSVGSRADWRLRHHNPPVPSTSLNSNAAQAWKALANTA